MSIQLKEATIDGKKIGYCSETVFLVQVGRYKKGVYGTKYTFVGDLGNAVFHYNAINIGNGYKKRLLAPTFNKPVIARQWS